MVFIVYVTKDKAQMSRFAADIVINRVNAARESRKIIPLGFATGSTPKGEDGVYAELIRRQRELDLDRLVGFNLDEYVGLPGETAVERTQHPQSYQFFMAREFYTRLAKAFRDTFIPRAALIEGSRLESELERFEGNEQAYSLVGKEEHGKAIVIPRGSVSDYLRELKKEVYFDKSYFDEIERRTGVSLQKVMNIGYRDYKYFRHYDFKRWKPFLWVLAKLNLIPINFYKKYANN